MKHQNMIKQIGLILGFLFLISFNVAAAAGDTSQWILFFGHFHPLILHLPIGILIIAFIFQFLSGVKKFNFLESAVEFTLLSGMIAAVVAACLGYMLSLSGEYGGVILDSHQWLGFGLAATTIILFFLKRKQANLLVIKIGMVVMMVVLTATGHYGGMLTHGENYLVVNMPSGIKSIFGVADKSENTTYNFDNIDDALVFNDLVQPILETKCVTCHNSNKVKGGLRLDNKEGLLKGGENGKILTEGALNKSELIKLVHLPVTEEKHMPPKGKTQLLYEEITLLEWWVENGADFDVKVADLEEDEKIANILASIEASLKKESNPVYSLKVEEADQEVIRKIKDNGIYVKKLSSEIPFLEARLEQVPEAIKSALGGISDQLTWLNLARSNCTNNDLADLASFPNITKLQLQQTNVDDAALAYISKLPFLEYLNLYGTNVTDEGIVQLSQLKHLKSLYLWNTKVTSAGIATLKKSLEKLSVDQGLNINQLDTVRLAKPQIIADKTLFKSNTLVRLELAFEGVQIFYTTDGSVPDKNSNLYAKPVEISNTCEVKAVAMLDGWGNSEVATKEFIKVRYVVESIDLTNNPADQYAGQGANTLTDGEKGSSDFRDGKWLGFHQVDLLTNLDLGEVIQPGEVIVSCLEDIGSYIFFPKSIAVEGSLDGYNFTQLRRLKLPVPLQSQPGGLKNFSLKLDGANVRYIRIKAESVGLCPAWHPGAGDKAWIFADEIIVN